MATQTKNKCEKIRILRRIICKMHEEKNCLAKSKYDLNRAVKYTGLHWKVLEELDQSSTFVAELGEIDRSVIYDELMRFYLTNNSMPTTRKLFEALYKKIPPYVDIGNFRKILVKMDFIWKRSQDFCMFVIEKPEVVIERYNYLKYILQYRDDGKNIYFVDENALEASSGYLSFEQSNRLAKTISTMTQQRVIYVVSKKGTHCVKFISNFDQETFENWVSEDLLPSLPTSSVVVYSNLKHHNEKVAETPSPDSLKIEMTEWLERNAIPFEPEMSKYELFSLIETYTNLNENMYKIDRIIEAHGHHVLRIPNCIKKLTPANLLRETVNKNANNIVFNNTNTWDESVSDRFNELIDCIPVEKYGEYDNIIETRERLILKTDKAVDLIFDDLLVGINNNRITDENDSDIPSCSDSE